MRKAKSYWMPVSCDSDRDRTNIKSWFHPLCNDMTPEKAEILCDAVTDREKKMRAVMVDKHGKRHMAVRTRGVNFSISIEPLAA